MLIEKMRPELENRKQVFAKLGIKKVSDSEYELRDFVLPQINKMAVKYPTFSELTSFSRDNQISKGINTLEIYGSAFKDKLSDIYSSTKLLLFPSRAGEFLANISFCEEDGRVAEDSGRINYFKAPKQIIKTDFIWYSHEGIHALKDTNFNEYRDLARYCDVLPLFHELVVSDQLKNLTYTEWARIRYSLLQQTGNVYKLLKEEKTNKDKELYNIAIDESSQYLSSYYYAVILYDLYLQDRNSIIELVSKVLNHEMTTEELLKKISIINPSSKDKEIFISYNDKIISRIK